MTIPLKTIPSFTLAEALEFADREFGVAGRISPLPSERDQNFLIANAAGRKFVLKIANSNDPPELLDFQNQAMRHVGRSLADCRVQEVISSRRGSDLASIHNARTATDHCARLLTWIDGEVLAKCTAREPALLESIGTNMARIDAALRDFTHPAMHRELQWDLRQAGKAREHAALLPADRRGRVERIFSRWELIDWSALRHSVIHGDANDYNVLAEGGRMVGLLDFGDMVHTATACDLAIALAYTMLDQKEPLRVAVQVVGAYHGCYRLTDIEQRALFPLVLSRLGLSVCYAAHNRLRNPDDAYQVVTEAAAWNLLDQLEVRPEEDLQASIVEACAAPLAT